MMHSIYLVNSWSRDGNHEFMTCEWNKHFSEIVNFVIVTSSLFMFTLDNIRYEGDTNFVFVVLLLYDKILSNPSKMLKKRSIDSQILWLSSTAAIFNHEVENSSCINPIRVHCSWSRVHEVIGMLFHPSWTRVHELNRMQHKSRDTVNCHMYDSYVQDSMHMSHHKLIT